MQDMVNKTFDKQISKVYNREMKRRFCLGSAVEESAGFSRDNVTDVLKCHFDVSEGI